MDFFKENYIIIIIIGLFFVFALIGYLIDMLRKNEEKETEEQVVPIKVDEIDIPEENIDLPKENETEEKKEIEDNGDELLEKYDKE